MGDVLPSLSAGALARYSRQIQLAEIGVAGQQRLVAAAVLVVGAGGLGSPAALYLTAAGVGTLGIADFDLVEEHNLHRQLLHDTSTVGETKIRSAANRLHGVNPLVRIVEHAEGITTTNALEIFAGYDVIVDGTDNFSARYLNNDAACLARKPLVYGSVYKFEGQVTVFNPAVGGPCHRCLFPSPPPPHAVPGCGEAGVLGALCGVIGSLQALEAIKLITGIGVPLTGRLLTYDALQQSFSTLRVPRDPACPLCGDTPSIHALSDAMHDCVPPPAPVPPEASLEIDVTDAQALLHDPQSAAVVLDVREPWETAVCQLPGSLFVPMTQVRGRLHEIPRDRPLVVLCHHGARSRGVTAFLRAHGYPLARNLAGGIATWTDRIDPRLRRY